MILKKVSKTQIVKTTLISYLLISVNSLNICRKYCPNPRICSEEYFECLSYYRNQRLIKSPDFFSSMEEQKSSPRCGKQFFKPQIASYASDPNIRIVGGVAALKAEFPWMVSLQKLSRDKFVHFCGGAVISDYYILTAAHCADIFIGKEDKLRIRLGSNNIANINDGVYMKVAKVIVHKFWDRDNNFNDIALYQTVHPIKYSIDEESGRYLINSVCLPQKTDVPPGFAMVIGWGRTDSNSPINPHLQKAMVPIFPLEKCKINYKLLGSIDNNMFCYGGEGELDSCEGDSGGPLVAKTNGNSYFIVGIVSYGVPCALSGYPTVYTKVANFLDWIYEKAKL